MNIIQGLMDESWERGQKLAQGRETYQIRQLNAGTQADKVVASGLTKAQAKAKLAAMAEEISQTNTVKGYFGVQQFVHVTPDGHELIYYLEVE